MPGRGPEAGFVAGPARPGARRPLEAVGEAGGWQQSSTAPAARFSRAGGLPAAGQGRAASGRQRPLAGGAGPRGAPGGPRGRPTNPGPCTQRAGCRAGPASEHRKY